jgi:hypothetical protein
VIILRPGDVTLAQWRAIYRGETAELDHGSQEAMQRSAATVADIIAKGDAVYGINTGFGKLANVSIAPEDLARLQRNIVLSHAAGVGEPMPVPVVRLMMALKLASLGHGASGVALQTTALLEAMIAQGLTPVVPCQGSVGASGDLAPLAHMTSTMIGVGEIFVGDARLPAEPAWRRSRWGRRKVWRCSTARSSPPPMRSPACSPPTTPIAPPSSPALLPPTPPVAPTHRSTRASTPCAGIPARSKLPPPCETCWRDRPSAPPTSPATTACKTPTAYAASRR